MSVINLSSDVSQHLLHVTVEPQATRPPAASDNDRIESSLVLAGLLFPPAPCGITRCLWQVDVCCVTGGGSVKILR